MIRDNLSAVAGLRSKELTTLAGGVRASSKSTGLIDFAISVPIWEKSSLKVCAISCESVRASPLCVARAVGTDCLRGLRFERS